MGFDERQPAEPALSPSVPSRDAEPRTELRELAPGAPGAELVGFLAGSGVSARGRVLLAMQRTCGNARVARMLEPGEPAERENDELLPLLEDEDEDEDELSDAESIAPDPQGVVARRALHDAPLGVMRSKGAAAKKLVGWIVTVGERKLVKRAAIYTEKEMAKLLAKGYNVLVKDGRGVARRVAKKVWADLRHDTGHYIKKAGKWGLPHYQPFKQVVGKVGEKGWHIFYTALPVLLYSEDVDAMAVYEDKYPGESKMNYLTVTHYAGEDSWLSFLDWINPGELLAIGGDLGRDWDRERTKELKALVLTRLTDDGGRQTYELDPDGVLQRVIVVSATGQQKELSAVEYYEFLATHAAPPAQAPAEDGTESEHYASTFDADYRIYISKKGWRWDRKTAAFYLPENYAKQLVKVGEFWVMADRDMDYVYAYTHPRHRTALHQPGFQVPEAMASEYFDASDRAAWLERMLESQLAGAALFDAMVGKALTALTGNGSEGRTPIRSGGSERRTPIRTGGSE